MKWPLPVAVAASLVTGALVLTAVVLAAFAPTEATIVWAAVGGVCAALSAGLGVVIARGARPKVIGALLGLVGLAVALTAAREIGWRVLARHPETLASLDWLVALLAESSVWLFAALALLLLYFPDGHLPSPRWRPVPWLLVATAFVHHAYGAVDSEPFQPPLEHLARPFGPPPFAIEIAAFIADLTLLALLIACTASLVVRYRRSEELQRRQLKWLALAGVGVPGFIVVCLIELLVFGQPEWGSLAIAIAIGLGVPAAAAIAMLRHDLYDIDKALATTVVYGLASAALLGIFACTSFAGGLVLGRDSTVAAAAATALAAVALSPLRRGLKGQVDRRLYPLRRAAVEAIADLQRDIHAGRARPEQLGERLRAALRDPELRIGYRIPGGAGLVDESGAALDAAASVPVVIGGAPIGALLPGARSMSAELLRELGAASATLMEVVRLRLEVIAALRDVEASRARLVHAGDEERRRLERDLHDGAQQRLVSLGMALRVAQRHLDDGTTDVNGLIDQAVAELSTAVVELRQIAHGLRPSSLDDGLHAALAALTQHLPIPVILEVQPEPLPDDVATTVYYVTSEAITNAVKHAGATRIDVRVARCNGHLEVCIADDGRGGATLTAGSGLAGLSDRVHAIGGALALQSYDGRGTIVEAMVPCES
jgi:signal transduction histidine kinase